MCRPFFVGVSWRYTVQAPAMSPSTDLESDLLSHYSRHSVESLVEDQRSPWLRNFGSADFSGRPLREHAGVDAINAAFPGADVYAELAKIGAMVAVLETHPGARRPLTREMLSAALRDMMFMPQVDEGYGALRRIGYPAYPAASAEYASRPVRGAVGESGKESSAKESAPAPAEPAPEMGKASGDAEPSKVGDRPARPRVREDETDEGMLSPYGVTLLEMARDIGSGKLTAGEASSRVLRDLLTGSARTDMDGWIKGSLLGNLAWMSESDARMVMGVPAEGAEGPAPSAGMFHFAGGVSRAGDLVASNPAEFFDAEFWRLLRPASKETRKFILGEVIPKVVSLRMMGPEDQAALLRRLVADGLSGSRYPPARIVAMREQLFEKIGGDLNARIRAPIEAGVEHRLGAIKWVTVGESVRAEFAGQIAERQAKARSETQGQGDRKPWFKGRKGRKGGG